MPGEIRSTGHTHTTQYTGYIISVLSGHTLEQNRILPSALAFL